MSASSRRSVFYSQNFLKDPCLVAFLLNQSSLERDDVVYEIGPGKGIITKQLALRYREVVAIEKDPHLAERLQRDLASWPNVTIHQGDFLCYSLPQQLYKLFANIPFNITSAIVTKLTTALCPPDDAYLIMQQEAAKMFLGEPGESLRSILLKPWFELAIVHRFERRDFTPAPRVDVVLLRLRKRGPPLIQGMDRQRFRDFVVHSFTTWPPAPASPLRDVFTRQQRKYIQHTLGIVLDGTPTSLAFEQWLNLFKYFLTVGNKQAERLIAGSEQRLILQQNSLQKIHRTRQNR